MLKRLRKLLLRVAQAAAVLLATAVTITLMRNRPISPALPHAFVRPIFAKLPETSVCWVEFDQTVVPGQFATSGITHMQTWDLTASGLLIRHPKGVVLVDTGSSSHFQEEIAGYPFWSHLYFEILSGGKSAAHPAPEVLRAHGIDTTTLTALLPSHIHNDHAGGLVDLPGLPVLLSQEEIDFARRNRNTKTIPVVPAYARTIEGRTRRLQFAPKPYEAFDESDDMFGDDSVVVVKLPGHTPGSVGVFVNLSPQLRIFHVGDAVMVSEAVERRLSKSLIMLPYENDIQQADRTVAKLSQLHALDPSLLILPAHDRLAWKRVFGSSPACVDGSLN